MEFPFGGGHHHRRHCCDDDKETPRFPPPCLPESPYPPTPPPPVAHELPGSFPAPGHGGGEAHHFSYYHYYGPGAPAPPFPAPEHYAAGGSSAHGALSGYPTVRIFTRADENYSLSIRDGNLVLAYANPRDEHQHWIKDMRHSTQVKDEEGFPAFALINKATGEALKHSIGATHPVRLIKYNPDYLDESVLWTESRDVGHGFRCIRMVNNIRLNFDAFHGDEDHGGVHDGTTVVLWEWLKGKNQSWKIVPYCKSKNSP